eukprot:gene7856-9673_t
MGLSNGDVNNQNGIMMTSYPNYQQQQPSQPQPTQLFATQIPANQLSGGLQIPANQLSCSAQIPANQQSFKLCLKCQKKYYAFDFNNQVCSYHLSNFKDDRWMCCNRVGREATPCFSTYHIEDETTTNILNSMTIPKPDIIQQNNPIYQNMNFGYIGAEKILFEGILKKQGKTLGFWVKRRFRLTHSTLINYYDETESKVHRVFQLEDIAINYRKMATDMDNRICMVIHDGTRNHFLYSPNPNQTDAWINALITQKRILLQSRSNQLLQNTAPHQPFPLSSSPPPSHLSTLYMNFAQQQQQQQLQQQQQSYSNYSYLYQPPPQYPYQQQPQIQQPQPQIQIGYQMINNIPIDNCIQQQQQQQFNNNVTPGGNPDSNAIQWVQHRVTTTDTLAGLAIKYNTTIDVIKRINLIKNNQCITHQTLLVPVSGPVTVTTQAPQSAMTEKEKQRKLIQLFAVSENVSAEEARSYLETNDWDIVQAIKQYKDDLGWELHNPFPGPRFC